MSRVLWLKDGDASTKLFHGVMEGRKISNGILNMVLNGAQVEGVRKVRKTMFDHFDSYFRACSNVRLELLNFQLYK